MMTMMMMIHGAPGTEDPTEATLEWLEWMRMASVQPDVVSYNVLLKQSAHAKRWKEALSILGEMASHKVDANIITVNTAIDACLQAGKGGLVVNLALSVHKWDLEIDEVTCSSILKVFQREREVANGDEFAFWYARA